MGKWRKTERALQLQKAFDVPPSLLGELYIRVWIHLAQRVKWFRFAVGASCSGQMNAARREGPSKLRQVRGGEYVRNQGSQRLFVIFRFCDVAERAEAAREIHALNVLS